VRYVIYIYIYIYVVSRLRVNQVQIRWLQVSAINSTHHQTGTHSVVTFLRDTFKDHDPSTCLYSNFIRKGITCILTEILYAMT
jgi:hypothetical protein